MERSSNCSPEYIAMHEVEKQPQPTAEGVYVELRAVSLETGGGAALG
jgi:hypothetical protein